jgi:hypothetical protein
VVSDKEIARAIGQELRSVREALGWSRGQVVAALPSGIGDRTLLSYDHGTRHLTVVRLIEICRVLGFDAPLLLRQALQRARIYLDSMALRIDLKALANSRNEQFRPMVQWARNTLNDNPSGIVDVEPVVVENLARFIGCRPAELATYLSRFLPEDEKATNKEAAREEPFPGIGRRLTR